MTNANKNIVRSYTELVEGLTKESKAEIIASISKSLEDNDKAIEVSFNQSFGSFASQKSPEEIIAEIKSSRTFHRKNISF